MPGGGKSDTISHIHLFYFSENVIFVFVKDVLKILPPGTTIDDVRDLHWRVLCQYECWCNDGGEMYKAVRAEIDRRTNIALLLLSGRWRYSVEHLSSRSYNTEFSDSFDLDDEASW